MQGGIHNMPDEPSDKSRGRHRSSDSSAADPDPGRLAEDDRGNITWQWANNDVLQADDTFGAIERLRALVDPSLGVIDDGPPGTAKHNPTGLKTGYDPYESGTLLKTGPRKKKTDLRELSKWIETKRKLSDPSDEDSQG
jgi:hypothetical protein